MKKGNQGTLRCVVSDASSSNEAVHLQQRLKSLSTELVTLRNRLHVGQPPNSGKSPEKGHGAPAVPPRTTLPPPPAAGSHGNGHVVTTPGIGHPHSNNSPNNGNNPGNNNSANATNNNTLGRSSTTNNAISGEWWSPSTSIFFLSSFFILTFFCFFKSSFKHRTELESPKKRHLGQDSGIVSCVTALGCLPSPPIASIISDARNVKTSSTHQRCLVKTTAPSVGTNSTNLDDLIHLSGPLTEDAVLKCLQARFCAKQYHVSNFFLSIHSFFNKIFRARINFLELGRYHEFFKNIFFFRITKKVVKKKILPVVGWIESHWFKKTIIKIRWSVLKIFLIEERL